MDVSRGAQDTPPYREHLRVPIGWWLLAIPVIAILGGEVYAGFGGLVPPLVYGVLIVIVAGFMVSWSATSIEVRDGALRVGGASLPLSQAGEVVALDEKQAAALRGPRADPAAHLMLRPYLRRAVYISLANPGSGVPYWLVGTRHPAELAAAIERGRRAAAGQPVG